MKFKEYLSEEYYSTTKAGYRVFENPSAKELRELKMCRFIADDDNKILYVSDVYFLHPDFFKYLKPLRHLNKKNCFMGSGECDTGKIDIDRGGTSIEMALPNNFKKFMWLKPYFTTSFESFMGYLMNMEKK